MNSINIENLALRNEVAQNDSLKAELQEHVLLLKTQDDKIAKLQSRLDRIHHQWQEAQLEYDHMKQGAEHEQKARQEQTGQLLNTLEELRCERDSVKECEAEVLENLVNMRQQNAMLVKSIEELRRDYHDNIRIQSGLVLEDEDRVKETVAFKVEFSLLFILAVVMVFDYTQTVFPPC